MINLGIDCIDLLQLHCPPSEICSKKETYEMMDEIVKKGKIAYYGVTVHKLSDAMEAIQFPNVKSIQIVFNIFRQKPAETFFKEAKKRNVAIIVRGPLASGLLTGEINQETKFPENDHRNYNINGKAFDIGDTFSGVNFEKGLKAVEKLKDLLPDNFSLTDLALKWILMHDEVSVVIPGATNKSQVQMNTHAADLEDISSLLPKINSIYAISCPGGGDRFGTIENPSMYFSEHSTYLLVYANKFPKNANSEYLINRYGFTFNNISNNIQSKPSEVFLLHPMLISR